VLQHIKVDSQQEHVHCYMECVDCRYKVTDSTRDYNNNGNRDAHLTSYVFL